VEEAKAEAKAGQALLQDVGAQMDQVREPIARFLDTGAESTDRQASAPGIDPAEPQPILSGGKYFDGSLARRRSCRTKRRYDSGVGLLEEDEEGGSEETNMENVEN
jgi:hypothetical protein